MTYVLWAVAAAVALLVLDRLLLWAERRGWIYYRKVRPVRGVSQYHLTELSTMLGGPPLPAIEEEVRQDESGDPLGPGRADE